MRSPHTHKCQGMNGMAVFPSLKSFLLSLTVFSSFIFFLLSPPPSFSGTPLSHFSLFPRRSLHQSPFSPPPSCSSVLQVHIQERCSFSLSYCNGDSNGLINYASLHFCIFRENLFLSIPCVALILLFQFYFLVKTAQDCFSVVVTKLSTHLNLSPSMGAVTLLALGNGAPDVFASVAAVRGGHPRTGFGAILSAGTFVSALVVGFVAIYAAPFSVDPAPFIRDVFFYLVAAFALFYVYLSGEIFLWQAIGFVGFYVFFLGFVFWMDVVVGGSSSAVIGVKEEELVEVGLIGENGKSYSKVEDFKPIDGLGRKDSEQSGGSLSRTLGKITRLSEVPVLTLLKLTIPAVSPSEWSRFYLSANITLCPLVLLYACRSFIPLDHRIVFLIPHSHLPLWSVVLFTSFSLGLLHYIIEREPPETEQMPTILVAFVMSVFWISTVAGELLDCLAAVGTVLDLPPSLLGMTVLAWGNSIGDLVADVAVAKAGQPAMAMSGCFAGPMFNMLVGLGTALVIQTADVYPKAYELQFNLGIVIAFVFLFSSLMGSLLVVTWFRFRVPRFWGFCLVGLYSLFIAISLIIAKFSG